MVEKTKEKETELEEYTKEADPLSMPVKYLKARMRGMTKADAQREAGYADIYHGTQIENTKTYQNALQKYLLEDEEVSKELNKNIKQDDSKSAKNKAIDMYLKLKDKYPKGQRDFEGSSVNVIISDD